MQAAIRPARIGDLDRLVSLEAMFPEADRISRRSFRRFLRGPAAMLVVDGAEAIEGAAVVLFRRGAGKARLYSLSIAPFARGRGLARALLSAAEALAAEQGSHTLRLEVRASNLAAISLYESTGFGVIARLSRYYGDGEDAQHMEKRIVPHEDARH